MTLTNHFAPLTYIDTSRLSDKGQRQVTEFVQFVEPLIDDIKLGDSAKAKVAEYFLQHQSTYTDGARNLLLLTGWRLFRLVDGEKEESSHSLKHLDD